MLRSLSETGAPPVDEIHGSKSLLGHDCARGDVSASESLEVSKRGSSSGSLRRVMADREAMEAVFLGCVPGGPVVATSSGPSESRGSEQRPSVEPVAVIRVGERAYGGRAGGVPEIPGTGATSAHLVMDEEVHAEDG